MFKQLEQQAAPWLQRILNQPFLVQLAQGVLPIKIMRGYLQQDQLYLFEFSKALAMLADKMPVKADRECLQEFSLAATSEEDHLYEVVLNEPRLASSELMMSEACHAYINFLKQAVADGVAIEGLAAVLPCFWVYAKVGKALVECSVAGNPYQAWIDCYASDAFGDSTNKLVALFDRLTLQASEQQLMASEQLFMHGVQLEWQFWDAAYKASVSECA